MKTIILILFFACITASPLFALGNARCTIKKSNTDGASFAYPVEFSESSRVEIPHGTLNGTIQFAQGRIVQVMIENKAKHIMTNTGMNELETNNFNASKMLQDLQSGDSLEINCNTL